MRTLRVTTWNVLHRVHAVNWKESPVDTYPDERLRIAGVSAFIARWFATASTSGHAIEVVCLQEVSGDQLVSLRSVLGGGFQVFEHLYPRVPRIRGGGPLPLEDATEHLVSVVNLPTARQLDARTFDTDPGKGLLAVDVSDGMTVINTHVSFGERGKAQLDIIAAMARAAEAGAIVLGDFNAPVDGVKAMLGEPFALSDIAGQRPTRIATSDRPGRTIDHVAVLGGTLESATVLDGEGLSDHNPVTARVVLP